MDIKSNRLLIARIEEDDEESDKDDKVEEKKDDEKIAEFTDISEKVEKIVFIGSMEDNENYEENPKVESGALHTIIEAAGKNKTNIYEV